MSVSQKQVIERVMAMTNFKSEARKLCRKNKLGIMSVTWEDCARNKGSVWGPCISDMTLQVGTNNCMPVIREPNFSDTTWDVQIEKIPVIVGNQTKSKDTPLKSISLKEYLTNFSKYITCNLNGKKTDMNLYCEERDSHVIMSSQCCFLPIAKNKESKFNVALYNYQSRSRDPAVLVIVSTAKGTSAQIIEGRAQKLLFNNNGKKADFVGQRLSDNRMERGVEEQGEMTKEEKQDNVIVVIQVPLKTKPRQRRSGKKKAYVLKQNKKSKKMTKDKKTRSKSCKRLSESAAPDVEAAIIKVAARTAPRCICKANLKKMAMTKAYPEGGQKKCWRCHDRLDPNGSVFHCLNKKKTHKMGYDICLKCGYKEIRFDELNGLASIKRDQRYPIRVTLQYYAATSNGIVNDDIIAGIAHMLKISRKQADFVGSLVTQTNPNRATEWVVDTKEEEEEEELDGQTEGDEYTLVKTLLKECDIYGEYFAVFQENEVTDELLGIFDAMDQLKDILPKLGPRMKFWKALENCKSITEPGHQPGASQDFVETIAF